MRIQPDVPLSSFYLGQWQQPLSGETKAIPSAVDERTICLLAKQDYDAQKIIQFALKEGANTLSRLTFHDRARRLKSLATYLNEHKQLLYDLSHLSGATHNDNLMDIDGGIGTLFVYASKGRREMPDQIIYCEGETETLSRNGTFLGQHICTSKKGVAVQINAFNFPVWGMLEKFAQAFLAGVPSIVKPASITSYLSVACVDLMQQSGFLPSGSLQLLLGRIDGLMQQLHFQDMVRFTGSAQTAQLIQNNLPKGVEFTAEQDSLNGAILGQDVTLESPEYHLYIKEVIKEVSAKAGQKCTAMRRLIVPTHLIDHVSEDLRARLIALKIGNPALKDTQMGALVSQDQRQDVINAANAIGQSSECLLGVDTRQTPSHGAFMSAMMFRCLDPNDETIHSIEAFGPVISLIGYDTTDQAVNIANKA